MIGLAIASVAISLMGQIAYTPEEAEQHRQDEYQRGGSASGSRQAYEWLMRQYPDSAEKQRADDLRDLLLRVDILHGQLQTLDSFANALKHSLEEWKRIGRLEVPEAPKRPVLSPDRSVFNGISDEDFATYFRVKRLLDKRLERERE